MSNKVLKRIGIASVIGFAIVALSACKSPEELNLQGVNVVWYPFSIIWDWLWGGFTPRFWEFVERVWILPPAIAWLAGIIVNLLGGVLYAAILLVTFSILIVLGVISGVVWFIAALINALFALGW